MLLKISIVDAIIDVFRVTRLNCSFPSVSLEIAVRFINYTIPGVITASQLKAISHSTIFDIPMRPVREDQRYR